MVSPTSTSSAMDAKRALPLLVESSDADQFALFPDEASDGVTITPEENSQLSPIYSQLYETYIARLSARLVHRFDITEPAARILTRRALVPLIHCFLDRLVRVAKAIDRAPGQLTVPRQELFPTLETIEAFEECAVANPAFNQSMISFVARVWQLPETDAVPLRQPFGPGPGFRNNLFRLHGRTLFGAIRTAWLRFLASLPRSRFPALTMSNDGGALFERGFYATYLKDITPQWPLTVGKIDTVLREQLFSDELIDLEALDRFIALIDLAPMEKKRATALFNEFVQAYYPPSLLESIPENMSRALRVYQGFNDRALFSSSGRNSRSTYLVAGAKQRGIALIDSQHGGNYGYLKEVSVFIELEYPGVDQFLSWGWSRLPDRSSFRSLAVVGLPSPWLSERKHYWTTMKIGGDRDFDVLLMSNMLKRFPAAPPGASRIDLVSEFAASLKQFVQEASQHKVRILHKPYNATTVNLLPKTMQELEAIGGSQYLCLTQLDKGLTRELVQACHVVVWDTPGTGFIECLASKIPTLVYWPRTSTEEEAWVKPIFLELECLGIVHREVDTLIAELDRFKESPESWMAHPDRVSLVDRFCREFAWTSDDWPRYWRRYLDGLAKW